MTAIPTVWGNIRFVGLAVLLVGGMGVAACEDEEDRGVLDSDGENATAATLDDVDLGGEVTLEAELQEALGEQALIIGGGFLQSEALVLLDDGVTMPEEIVDGADVTVIITGEVIPIEIPALVDDFLWLEEDLDELESYSGDRAVRASAIELVD